MNLIDIAKKVWGDDFTVYPYTGPTHTLYRGIAGTVTLVASIPLFCSEQNATSVRVIWSELVPVEKSIDDSLSQVNRSSCDFPVVDSKIDECKFIAAIKEAELQVRRNKMILRAK